MKLRVIFIVDKVKCINVSLLASPKFAVIHHIFEVRSNDLTVKLLEDLVLVLWVFTESMD